jgi:(1->4)-alpha-D-glucan 1-alpha-D-glucosylmutase
MLTSTYRLQVHKDFPLARVREIVPYLRDLGISHVYTSPLLAARPGSTHGYDVVDPSKVNPEVGTEDDLRMLAEEAHAAGLGIVLDIVPNHMGIGKDNPYWEDVLAHGRQSRYARWFDIEWDAHAKRRGKVVLPVLGDELAAVLEKGELGLDISESGGVRLKYYDNTWPLDPATVPPELQLVQFDPNAKPAAEEWARGEEGRKRLRALLDKQHYKLAFWRCAPSDINYRRFFDVNDLAAVRTEDAEVFAETHAKILEWVADGVLDGLRIDHVDGLRDPLAYLERLRGEVEVRAAGRGAFPIFVEKIISPGEHLRREWPVEGTTGYEVLNDIEAVFIHNAGALSIEQTYRRLRRAGARERELTFEEVAREGKLKVLRGALRADMRRLARLLARVEEVRGPRSAVRADGGALGPRTPDLGPASERPLVAGIIQLIASLPVYRTYIDGRHADPYAEDREVLERAIARAQEHADEEEVAVVRRIAKVFLEPLEAEGPARAARLDFIMKFQQTSGPATAKGVEDTALYIYFPLASRNEVGGEPDRPLHDAVERVHRANAERARDWPLALVCTNTHDTKRSADVRARIDVLSEVAHEWELHETRWRRLNRRHKTTVKGKLAPDVNTEYLLYQTLVGLWPTPRRDRREGELPERLWFEGVAGRLERYMMKAIKEGKTHTSWTDPDEEYEESVKRFVHAIVDREGNTEFLADVARFVHRVAPAGLWNALARTLLQLTAPGTPDTYQGDELGNHTLVDPDNRRPVNYEHRRQFLAELGPVDADATTRAGLIRQLTDDPADPRLKLLIVRQALHARRAMPELFTGGDYLPLAATGACADHVVAFARRSGRQTAVTVVPRLVIPLLRGERKRATGDAWGDTRIELPADLAGRTWRSAITGRDVAAGDGVDVAGLFAELPLDLLISGR